MCSFTFSVLLMIGETASTRELPLLHTLLFPVNVIEGNESALGRVLAQSGEWGEEWACRGCGGIFTCPFHPPVNINGEEGNHCHSSRRSTKPPDCILDSDMPFFSPTGKPNVLAQRD